MQVIKSLKAMTISKIFLSTFLTLMCACNCTVEKNGEENNTIDPPTEVTGDVIAYITKSDQTKLFEKIGFDFGRPGSMSANQVTYDRTKLGPEIDGFGLALTTATCYNLLKMQAADRQAFLEENFSKTKGIGSSLIRVSIGASDFCVGEEFTWCDEKGIENFAVHSEDKNLLFPILREIYAINPDVKIIGSPWSCPRWMKGGTWGYEGYDNAVLEQDFNSWTSGRLKPSCYQAYAQYFVKWIQTMEAEGFNIYAITMQNEPLNHGNSMSLYMPWKDQAGFIKVLGSALRDANLDVKIMLFDHNYNYDNKEDQLDYPLHIYADAEASQWADGSAWHSYGGHVSELDKIRRTYPEKDIWFTEASIGEWYPHFDVCLMNDFANIFMGTLQRGGKGVTLWNLMLDENNGPFSPQPGSCKTCFGGVTIYTKDYKMITKNSHWYNVAHASIVVKPGAKMMERSGYEFPNGVQCEMFLNTDNSIGVLLLNDTNDEQYVVFVNETNTVRYTAPSKSIVSLLWTE